MNAIDEATVTSPPAELLYTTCPLSVDTAVAPLGVLGARARLVGGGRVEAVKADDAANTLLSEASALVSEACWLLCADASELADEMALVSVVP